MKKTLLILVTIFIIVGMGSCSVRKYNERFDRLYSGFKSVEVMNVDESSNFSIRAIELSGDDVLVLAHSGFESSIGYYENDKLHKREGAITSHTELQDSKLEFRSIAKTKKYYFFLSVSSPAYLYRASLGNFSQPVLVYQEDHKKVFYDSMDFWNDQEGIAIGDPTDDCMSIIITRDGGNTWTKLSCNDLPKAKEGEAAFAASDTNISIVGDHTWVATGGKASRVMYSPDKGKNWEVYDTPIVQGKETTGIYSIDFYDENNGFAIGGDYTKPNDTLNNKIRTNDGGKTWQVVANGKGPGYRSCVQYVPNSDGKELVAIGFKGIDYSNDYGDSWKHLSDEGFYTIRFLNDSVAYAAGKGRISKLTFRE